MRWDSNPTQIPYTHYDGPCKAFHVTRFTMHASTLRNLFNMPLQWYINSLATILKHTPDYAIPASR